RRNPFELSGNCPHVPLHRGCVRPDANDEMTERAAVPAVREVNVQTEAVKRRVRPDGARGGSVGWRGGWIHVRDRVGRARNVGQSLSYSLNDLRVGLRAVRRHECTQTYWSDERVATSRRQRQPAPPCARVPSRLTNAA